MKLKKPEECLSLEDVRNEIDKIDKSIISLFSERNKYVEEIVRFKYDSVSIIAEARKNQVIRQRRKWAEERGLDAETFEKIYELLIESNIKQELKIFKTKPKK
ncbi:MAG: chorismate mutase [Prolixibacteraceae bacterium]|jgi:isochorismate pyruvate lyase|nr:chorismate mutase [Prolixibacteraceae bacterium]MDD4755159.1 chorismate mutase [Prolixibacteraceae bacterium]NLO03743.1 isochorismate-pyruvate lyase [Bacteroidales bacterium]